MKRRARGTGTIERRLRGGVVKFYARLPGTEQVPLAGLFDTWDEADAALDAAVKLVDAGIAKVRNSLGAFGSTVIDRRELAGFRNAKDDRRTWKRYVLTWECADWPIDHVKRKHVKQLFAALRARGLTSGSVGNLSTLLRAVFLEALDEELVDVSPCSDLRVKRDVTTRQTSTFLTLDELSALFWSADLEGKILIAFAVWTGMREGEIFATPPEDFHLDDEHPYVFVRYGAPGKPPKNGKTRRVPLFGGALAAARLWKELYKPAAASRWPIVQRPKFFFATKTGRHRQVGYPFGKYNGLARWRAWLQAAGIRRRVRFHDLRHTCGTLLLTGAFGRKWSTEEVKSMLGHSSINVTERYARALDSLAEQAARSLESGNGRSASSIAAISSEVLPTVYQLPTADPLSARFWSRLRDLNSRPTVYEALTLDSRSGGNQPHDAFLADGVGIAVFVLQRAASVGDVSRVVVERALNVLDAAEAERAIVASS